MKTQKKTTSSVSGRLFLAAVEGRKNAHAPYSKFKVGAALMTKSGQISIGCNVENASYGGTVCAERTAILSAVANGSILFTDICVVAESKKLVPPCALCLQTMAEFCEPDFRVHLATPRGIKKTYKLNQLLPFPFNRKFL
jgi:homotetrameric cytidine deaminase